MSTYPCEMEQQLLEGEVLPSNCVNSIIVDISELNDTSELEHSYPNTVVAHKKYRVIEKALKRANNM